MSIITCQFCYFLTPFHSWLLFMIYVLKVAKTNGISDIVTSSEMRRAINCKANLFHMVLCEASNELGLIDGTRWQLEYYAMIPSDWSSNMVWHITPTPTLPLFCAGSIETDSFSTNPTYPTFDIYSLRITVSPQQNLQSPFPPQRYSKFWVQRFSDRVLHVSFCVHPGHKNQRH